MLALPPTNTVTRQTVVLDPPLVIVNGVSVTFTFEAFLNAAQSLGHTTSKLIFGDTFAERTLSKKPKIK